MTQATAELPIGAPPPPQGRAPAPNPEAERRDAEAEVESLTAAINNLRREGNPAARPF